MIVVEGPDGSGKTTLAKRISERFGYTYHHEGPPKTPSVLQNYAGLLFKGVHQQGGKVVFDRLHLGENVYGPLLRGKSLIDGEYGLAILHRVLSAYKVRVIICLPPLEVCLANWRSRHALELVKDEAAFIKSYAAYVDYARELVEHKTVRYTIYDHTKDPDPFEVPPTPSEPTYHNWIGSRVAKYLVVGEMSNHPWLDLPFISLTGSSRYLNEVLWDAGFTEDELAFVNAVSLSGHRPETTKLRLFCFDRPGSTYIITLGGIASDIFMQADKRTYHPAYWQRFHSTKRQKYVDDLKEFRERTFFFPSR